MAVKVGESWVSEAAYAHAKQAQQMQQAQGGTLEKLSKQYPHTDFSTNTAPFQGNGTNNIAIAPNILRQMDRDPEKQLEYEALIYDCKSIQDSLGKQYAGSGKELVAQGFIIDSNGGLSSWCVTRSGGNQQRSRSMLARNDKSGWLSQMLGKPAAKPSHSMLANNSTQSKKAGGLSAKA